MAKRSSRLPAALIAVVAAFPLLASPTTAHAIPSSCSFGFYNTNSASYATCSVGTGQFRAKLRCDIPWGIDTVARGTWQNVTSPPSVSIAQCPLDARKGYEPGVERR